LLPVPIEKLRSYENWFMVCLLCVNLK
jgi:hypothetical protein